MVEGKSFTLPGSVLICCSGADVSVSPQKPEKRLRQGCYRFVRFIDGIRANSQFLQFWHPYLLQHARGNLIFD